MGQATNLTTMEVYQNTTNLITMYRNTTNTTNQNITNPNKDTNRRSHNMAAKSEALSMEVHMGVNQNITSQNITSQNITDPNTMSQNITSPTTTSQNITSRVTTNQNTTNTTNQSTISLNKDINQQNHNMVVELEAPNL